MASGADQLRFSTAVSSGLSIGSAFGAMFSQKYAAQAEAEVAETRTMVADINAKRVARELRYQQGLAVVQNAAVGNSGSYGSALFAAADDARKKQEAINNELLPAVIENNRGQAALSQAKSSAAFNLVGSVASAYGDHLKTEAKLSGL